MTYKLLGTALASFSLAVAPAYAAEFVCQDDIKPVSYGPDEQRLVDQFWKESLVYLGQFMRALETPTGECKDSAEATIQTYDAATGTKSAPGRRGGNSASDTLLQVHRRGDVPVQVREPGLKHCLIIMAGVHSTA